MALFTDLQREVQETHGVVDSAIVFIEGIKAQLDALIAGGAITPAQLQEIVDGLDTAQAKLAAGIAANPNP